MSPQRASDLLREIRALIVAARQTAARSVNAVQVLTCFQIGRRIVEHEQGGKARAAYAARTVQDLARALTSEFGRGFSWRNLHYMRTFYLEYRDRLVGSAPVRPREEARPAAVVPGLGPAAQIVQMPSAESRSPFWLSWSQYVFLLSISERAERSFYEIEAAQNQWSLPELKRQYDAGLYERLALSRDRAKVRELATHGQRLESPADLLKSPYVLEFLGLDERADYSETQLEAAIIGKLEHFLLELGKGFLFEARQKRITFDADHYFVDLVFYNRLLRCYVLLDLKLGKLTHQDLGQMQMYVNYFDRYVKRPTEQRTVGIIMCKTRNSALVELTLPRGANIHAAEYRLYLPSKLELKRKLLAWAAEQEQRA